MIHAELRGDADGAAGPPPPIPQTEDELEEILSRPTSDVRTALTELPGDIVVLGAGGKMGPTLTAMLRRATLGAPNGHGRRVIAVSRWSSPIAEGRLSRIGVETVACDLAHRAAVDALPDAPLVVFMAGQKYGTTDAPAQTWAANTLVPAHVLERYRDARLVVFSTGNVYPRTPVPAWVREGRAPLPDERAGSVEADPLTPVGEYANSCVGRERLFTWGAETYGTRVAIVRLNYAIDLRYGVLVDIAMKVRNREPVDLSMGWVNVIWQGDANARAIECLTYAASPPFIVNLAGPDVVRVRQVAEAFGEHFGHAPVFRGTEGDDALLSDTTFAWRHLAPPAFPLRWMITWVAEWIARGNVLLDRPTHFEARDGRY